MKLASSPTAGAVGLTVTAVMAGLLTAGPALGVAGGTPSSGAGYGFVAKIEIGSPESGGTACSGALVGRRWVVTAKSCFGATVTAGAPARSTVVTVGRPDLTQSTGFVLPAATLVPHPNRDVVLIRLAAEPPASVVPVAIAAQPPAVGEQLAVAGFGRTATEWVPQQLHVAPFTVDTVGPTLLDVHATSGASTCKGDAGGPALVGNTLVALNGASWQRGCLSSDSTRDGATEIRLDDLRGWISEQTALQGQTDTIRNVGTGFCLSTLDAGRTVNTQGAQWFCTDGPDLSWTPRVTDGSNVELWNNNSGLCLGVGTTTTNGTGARLQTCGADGQKWTAEAVAGAPGGTVQYRNRLSNLCLAVPNSVKKAGTGLVVWTCGDATHTEQHWRGRSRDLGRMLRNDVTDKCIVIHGGGAADAVTATQRSCVDLDEHRWVFPGAATTPVEIRNQRTAKCLGVDNKAADAVRVKQFTCDGGSDQKWTIERSTVSGSAVIRFRNSFSNKCLGINGGRSDDGTEAIQWPCGSADHWFKR